MFICSRKIPTKKQIGRFWLEIPVGRIGVRIKNNSIKKSFQNSDFIKNKSSIP